MVNENFSTIFQANAAFVEEMFLKYRENPMAVSEGWRAYFEGFHEGFETAVRLKPDEHLNGNGHALAETGSLTRSPEQGSFEQHCASLVQAYCTFGHLQANLNPLGIEPAAHAALSLESYGFSAADLARTTAAGARFGLPPLTLGELVADLTRRFCATVGVEFEHLADLSERQFLYESMAKLNQTPAPETRLELYKELAKADALEKTIATKFIGKKRFSIEGADAQIPALETVFDVGAKLGAQEFPIAMAHRGRLNILVNCIHKPLEQLFAEFEGYPNDGLQGDGDVKYHGGYEADRKTRSGSDIRISLTYNPSHLEFVGCIVMGEARAKQVLHHGGNVNAVLPVVLHGDAAFAGQGVVYETLQMMRLDGYNVGGTIHIIANNQVGFTTNPKDGRSGLTVADIGKTVQSPIFHVNADDIENLHAVMTIATEYRQRFNKDVVIEIICFRRHGHNETDEPRFTQPTLYKRVDSKASPFETYAQHLGKQGLDERFNAEALASIHGSFKSAMNATYDRVKSEHIKLEQNSPHRGFESLRRYVSAEEMLKPVNSKLSVDLLKSLGSKLVEVPEGFTPNAKLARIILGERRDMVEEKKRIDWGMGELLAYATLLNEGFSVRLAGQDARRGTFSHRHGTLTDAETGKHFTSLKNCLKNDARIEIWDSLLSETAAMGFEYGYATQHTRALVIWEAQFGDFANGAQVIIDQFFVSGESKWGQTQGLVLLLPHGYEGQGPEHSSARLERFLQMAAQGNIQVCYFTNAKQLFHALRRQVIRDFRKPMVVMTPKSFLRNPRASTSFEELADGRFEEVLLDPRSELASDKVTRILLCTGKVAHDLLDSTEKAENKSAATSTAVVRIEQLHPFPHAQLEAALKAYPKAKSWAWVQEEPRNMGAATFIMAKVQKTLSKVSKATLEYVGRSERASPAVGLEKLHLKEQEALLTAAWNSTETIEI
ncbi:2-oxoglutarate dehydrogenase E1 component [bacterium]|nr:2-oxoglutarate dehydrogenase E1 component [bacterium]